MNYNQVGGKWQMPIVNNGINWVYGIEGAKAWQMTPNSNAILMDSENDGLFYIKVTDNVGMSSLRKFKYQEILDEPSKSVDLTEYVKKSELEDLLNSMLGGGKREQPVQTDEHKKSLI